MRRSSQGKGFTIIELLVVIFVIGLLTALILPAVQSARESSRRSQCRNNLRQLALAIQLYETAHQVFPINYGSGAYDATNVGTSWLQQILPYVDQGALHEGIRFGYPVADPANEAAAKTVIPVFLCPSDSSGGGVMGFRANVGGLLAITNYKSCAGSNWNWGEFKPISCPAGRFKDDSDGLEHGNGFICRGGNGQPVVTRAANVKDGLSNTFAVGEAVPDWCRHTWWFWFNASTATCAIPLNFDIPGNAATEPDDAWHDNYSFMSRHPGGGHFAMGDGSVRFIADQIDLAAYRHLATIDGGEPLGDF